MKEIKQAIVLVDSHRRPERRRNTAGRYRVGAKTEKEAEQFVRDAIGFGSVKFYYWDNDTKPEKKVDYKQVVKEVIKLSDKTPIFAQEQPRHASSPFPKSISNKDKKNKHNGKQNFKDDITKCHAAGNKITDKINNPKKHKDKESISDMNCNDEFENDREFGE